MDETQGQNNPPVDPNLGQQSVPPNVPQNPVTPSTPYRGPQEDPFVAPQEVDQSGVTYKPKMPSIKIFLILLILLIVGGSGVFGYQYYQSLENPPPLIPV